jgi:hypothetical protein
VTNNDCEVECQFSYASDVTVVNEFIPVSPLIYAVPNNNFKNVLVLFKLDPLKSFTEDSKINLEMKVEFFSPQNNYRINMGMHQII